MKRAFTLILCFLFFANHCTVLAVTWICSNCGKENEGKFCGWCGTKRQTEVNCSECGAVYVLELGYHFCPSCGTPLSGKSDSSVFDNHLSFPSNTVDASPSIPTPEAPSDSKTGNYTPASENSVHSFIVLPTSVPEAISDSTTGNSGFFILIPSPLPTPTQTATPTPTPKPTPTLIPKPKPTPTPTKKTGSQYVTLQKGDNSNAVKALQKQLKALGYLSSSVDGDFGGKTEDAVKQAQKDAGMSATGVATSEFQRWLYNQKASSSSSSSSIHGIIVTTGDVYLWKRASDANSDDKICVAYKGTKLNWDGEQKNGTYNGKKVTWYHVQYPNVNWYRVKVDGVTGWISEIYCSDQGNGTVRVFANSMQLRGSPSLDGKRLKAYVNKGDRISISKAEKTLEKGPSGWVPSKYAKVSN